MAENATSYYQREGDRMPQVFLWFLTAVVCLLAGWLLPVSYKSVHPVLLDFAGKDGPSLPTMTETFVAEQQYGPADMFVRLANKLRITESRQLGLALDQAKMQHPALFYWGGKDRQIEHLFSTNAYSSEVSLVQVFMSEAVRNVVYPYLTDSTSPGVQSIVRTRELEEYQRFVAANKPGGQPLDATIVLTALFYGSERLSRPFMDEVSAIAEKANLSRDPAALEEIYYSILVLGNRLNWGQLTEILHSFQTTAELRSFAALVNDRPEDIALAYCSTLMGESPGGIIDYFDKFGNEAVGHLAQAVNAGAPAVRLLLDRQVPIAATPGGSVPFAAPLVIRYPLYMYIGKIVLYIIGGISLLMAWARFARKPKPVTAGSTSVFGVQSQIPYADGQVEDARELGGGFKLIVRGAFVVILLVGLAFLSEPMLMRDIKPDATTKGYRFAGLSNSPVPKNTANNRPKPAMDQSTIISIMFFGLLQILVYMICLMKIREIDMHPAPANVKLRLMENEENLFDSGLYVGIAGTAAALVLQVLQVIEANLLAAYSSNLFGIVCVALVKIGHVRSFKRNLILQMQTDGTVPA